MFEELRPEIAERKSTTNWSPQPISAQTWDLLFEAARRAPSSWNHQPARYVAVSEKTAITALSDVLHRCDSWAKDATGLVVQAACPEDDDRVDGKDYYLYDCGLGMMSLVYQAQAMGISSRQMIGFDEQEVKRLLGIPERYRVVIITGLGYPSTNPLTSALADVKRTLTAQHKRFATEHLVSWQKWGGDSK